MSEPTRSPATGGTARPAAEQNHNIVDLVGRLTQQGAHLAREQVSLMQAEVREATRDVKEAVGAMAGAAVFGIAGLVVFLMGISYYVGAALENLALGPIIVGAITLVIAGILFASGRSKASTAHLKPDRSIDTISDTPAAATGDIPQSGVRHDR
ncbi:MAG: hypothetical protein GC147_07880 [Porphyrobacter sp.]|nr:hypothetical protein [Porphyrobacter sp.]